jgi:Putative regulator of cell autolysis
MELLKNLTNNLTYVIIIAFIVVRLKSFKKIILKDQFTRTDLIILTCIFTGFAVLGTYTGKNVNGAIANTRIIGVISGGILCGPFVGIVSGLIAGIHRFLIDVHGVTSLPCSITTIISGIISGVVFYKSNKNNRWFLGLIVGLFVESLEMLLIILLSKPFSQAIIIVKSIYLPMSFTNAVGIAVLIFLIQSTFNEKEEIAARQAMLALEIANKTLPYFRELDSGSYENICRIIKESTGADAVSITDSENIIAHVGIGSDHHKKGKKIITQATRTVIKEGKMEVLNSPEEINCPYSGCPLKSAIIAPLKDGNEIICTLKIYYSKKNSVSFINRKLIDGLSQLISTQLEISKLGRLQDMANKSEIKALQVQINPHFLFNALNTIVSFIRTNPDKARKLIISLSTYLRYNIENVSELVDIHKELEQVKAYIEIEKARFGDKLNVIFDIQDDINMRIPSLIIQPIVENSIRHGILEGCGSGTVKISVSRRANDNVLITIEDNGPGIPQYIIDNVYSGTMKENKIGLSNVHSRLKYTYGNGLDIERLERGTRVSFMVKPKEDAI